GEKRANYLNKGKHAWKTQRFKNAKTVDMTRFLYVCIQRRIIYSPSHNDDEQNIEYNFYNLNGEYGYEVLKMYADNKTINSDKLHLDIYLFKS
ncbi:TPA: hypothetical protein ACYIYQ_000843, partial [Staphylococcus aureus]